MCWAEKCCYFIPANVGCVCLGISSFVLSTLLLVVSISVYAIEIGKESVKVADTPILTKILAIDLNISSIKFILCVLMIIAALWMVFSCLLVIGIVKNKASFVLSYFAFAIFVIILCQLSALLVLLQNYWKLSIILFIASAIYIHFLVVVHTVYDLMIRGKNFTFHHQDQDDEPLANCFDEDENRI